MAADSKDKDAAKAKVVYPFYQYGEYEEYDPDHAAYYLPGSSVKGALLQEKKNKKELHVMVEDVPVEKNGNILRNLVKAQHLD